MITRRWCIEEFLPHMSRSSSTLMAALVNDYPDQQKPASATALVVDDEMVVRLIIAEMLSDLGWVVVEAADADAALEILRDDESIGLLVSDLHLPGGKDGLELIALARASRPGLKVLAVTGDDIACATGADAATQILQKPFRQNELARAVDDLRCPAVRHGTECQDDDCNALLLLQ